MSRSLAHVVLTLAAAVAIVVAAPARALGPDPFDSWRTADTPHFVINFRPEHRAYAQRVATIAERVYPRVTQQLQWEPRGRTQVLVLGEFDVPNGFATPLPFNTLAIFLAPPDSTELLDNSAWLELVITHEFTHVVHLDKVRGVPNVLQYIFGRETLLFPNAFQPSWGVEGIAVFNEGDPAAGRGRLGSPLWEALLRVERAAGFKPLAEINSGGRAQPLSKQYLYGAYFYEFLNRKYGPEAIFKYIHRYSGNIVPRLHTNPEEATGKTLDVLWREFLNDLGERVDRRTAALRAQPLAVGAPLGPVDWNADALTSAPDGSVIAVVSDALTPPRLQRIDAAGRRTTLARVPAGTRVQVRSDGRVLLAQTEVCGNRKLYYDLYVLPLDAGWLTGQKRLTSCGHYRRAVWAGGGIVALKLDQGRSALVALDENGDGERVLYRPEDGVELAELAATADGQRVALTAKRRGSWFLQEIDPAAGATSAAAPRTLLEWNLPLQSLHYSGSGALEFVAARTVGTEPAVLNVWRFDPRRNLLERLTHTDTGVVTQSGTGTDGSLTVGVLTPGGVVLNRMATTPAIESITLPASAALAAAGRAGAAAPAPTGATTAPPGDDAATGPLTNERGYLALRTIYPRAWFPTALSDRGLTAYGASTFGSDALGFHQYAGQLLYETSQKELLGSLTYVYAGRNYLSYVRGLRGIESTGSGADLKSTIYERTTHAQWVSTQPWIRVERQIDAGIGAALDRVNRVVIDGQREQLENKPIAAAFVDLDWRDDEWLSEGFSSGGRLRALFETYQPFNSAYDGKIWRFDAEGYVPLGRNVLSLRAIEARAHGGDTEPFQLGGATPALAPLLGPTLNDRTLPLRGYRSTEAQLRGRNARVGTIEFRAPIADIDRHLMAPPIGINRLSAAAFFDIGGTWDTGGRPSTYYRGAGVELLGEVRLLYIVPLFTRLGVARGLQEPGETRFYASLGRTF